MSKYKILEKETRAYGFDLKQVWREGDFAIYEQSKNGSDKKWYEAIQITKHEGYEIGGAKIPPSEVYPSNEKWGKLAFTCVTLEDAHKKIFFMKNHADIIAARHKEVE